MEIFSGIVLLIILLSLFNLVRYMLKIRKVMEQHKDNPNIKGISIVNGRIEVIENTSTPSQIDDTEDLETDPVCKNEVAKKDAYRILKDGKEYYFCSWECREAFLDMKSVG